MEWIGEFANMQPSNTEDQLFIATLGFYLNKIYDNRRPPDGFLLIISEIEFVCGPLN